MGILLQIIGVILAAIGFFVHLGWLFMVGGFICLFLDLVGFLSGRLNPIFPIFLFIGGYIIVGNWTGILWGAVISNLFEVVPILIGMGGIPFLIVKEKIDAKKQKKEENNKV